MFSRTWHGIVPLKMRAAFEQYEYQTGVKESLAIPGNRGAFLKIVEQGDFAHFFLCTKWDSMASMIAYAGQEPLIAVTYPEDEHYGLISDPIVIIQEVADDSDPFAAQDDIGGQSQEKSPIQGKNPAITPITYRSGDESLLDDIKELWEALNRHHRNAAVNFKSHYEAFTFAMRKKICSRRPKMGGCESKLQLIPKLLKMSATAFPGLNAPVMRRWNPYMSRTIIGGSALVRPCLAMPLPGWMRWGPIPSPCRWPSATKKPSAFMSALAFIPEKPCWNR
ncbi:hypothetical protein CHL1_002883 [Acetobacterium wieringae]|nr:hypothetical protein [Acetobacterium wieringae]URN83728.1 hypothetical protein CHL1_002883 [Acetobacterium wieringae]